MSMLWEKIAARTAPGKPFEGSPCMIWTGRSRRGYPEIGLGGKRVKVHILSYQLKNGVPLPGWHIHHKCREKLCINPKHLTPVDPVIHGHLHSLDAQIVRSPKNRVPYAKDMCWYGHKRIPGKKCGVCLKIRHRPTPCLGCGKQKERPGMGVRFCDSCLTLLKDAARKKKMEVRLAKALSLQKMGLCLCGRPLSTKWNCRPCADRIHENAKRWKAKHRPRKVAQNPM